MSARPLKTRARPRWSVAGNGLGDGFAASIAGLPVGRAIVDVGPPLFCNGPSRELTPCRSLAARPVTPEAAPMRLKPLDVIAPWPSGPCEAVFPATMVLARVKLPEALK